MWWGHAEALILVKNENHTTIIAIINNKKTQLRESLLYFLEV